MRLADRRVIVAGVVMVVAVLGIAVGLPSYWVFLATSATISALIALSVGVVHGRAGMVALCPMAFAGIGAWTVGWIELHTTLPFLVAVLFGALAAVPVGVAIGLPALRLRGVNLAVATLAFGGALAVVVFDKGFPGAIEQRSVGRPWFAESETGYFFLAVAILALVGGLLTAAARTGVGASWMAVRDSERATAALGHSVVTTKLLAFAASAFIAGLGGALLAGQLGVLSGLNFQPLASMVVFTAAVAFGSAYFEGAVLAGVATVFLPEVLRQLDLPQDIAPGLFAVAALQALAGGEGGLVGGVRSKLRHASAAALVVPKTTPVVTKTTLVEDMTQPTPVSRQLPAGVPRLEVRGVGVTYGAVQALNGVDLVIRVGTVHGLIGPNGAGKSTLVDVISGFVSPTQGDVLLTGEVITMLAPHQRARRGIRRSFQQGRVSPALSIGQYLLLSGRGQADRALVDELLEAFGCPPATTTIGMLDVGARRLVEVAATLASRPGIILLDEPAAGLAAEESARLAAIVAEVPERFDSAVLLVEHDIEMVTNCCDEISALDFGRVVTSGPPRDVLRDPAVIRSYLGGTDELEVISDVRGA